MKTLITIWLCWMTVASSSADCSHVSFELIQKVIVVQATVNGLTGSFIVDTGVSGLILNSQHFEGRDSDRQFTSVLGEISAMQVNYVSLKLGTFVKKNTYAEIIPMNIPISEKPMAIMGLLGCSIFRNSEILLDYENEQLVICEAGKNSGEITSFFNYEGNEAPIMLDLNFTGQLPYIRFGAGMSTLKLLLDTGAGITVIDERYKGKWQIYLMEEIVVGSLGMQPYRSQKFYMNGFMIGQGHFVKMRTIFFDMALVNQGITGPDIDGIVGFELLKDFTTLINFKKRKIYFWPRTHKILAALPESTE